MSTTDTRPPDALKLKPTGAEGLTYAVHLVGRDDVQSWSEPTQEWLDGANGAYEGDTTAMVWWRTTPEVDGVADAEAVMLEAEDEVRMLAIEPDMDLAALEEAREHYFAALKEWVRTRRAAAA